MPPEAGGVGAGAGNDSGSGTGSGLRPVLEVTDLDKRFPVRAGLFGRGAGWVNAVNGVSFDVRAGETLGVVGESGCGKTTLGKTVMRLLRPDGGRIVLHGRDITTASDAELREGRRDIQMVFQDPFSSLNPRLTCRRIVAEPLEIHGVAAGKREGGPGGRRCSSAPAFASSTSTAIRTSSPAASASGSGSRAPSPSSRR